MASQADQPGLSSILAELKDLKNTIVLQEEKISALRATQPGITASRVDDAFEAIRDIDEHLARIDQTRIAAPPRGEKTLARIEKLKAILKANGGAQTFKKLQEDLGLSPSEFTRLVASLDKRSFEITRRPGSKRGEKVLSLRVRIYEPLAMSRFDVKCKSSLEDET
jgi:hypothetical protein